MTDHLVKLSKRQLDIVFFALTEDIVCKEFPEEEVSTVIDVITSELNNGNDKTCSNCGAKFGTCQCVEY